MTVTAGYRRRGGRAHADGESGCLQPVDRAFYHRDTVAVAQELLGCVLIHHSPDGVVAGRITETEAYTQEDPASHSFRGRTSRNAAMFGPPGQAYVYQSHGVWWCLNAVTGPDGTGEAVLIRSAEPLQGWELMGARRGLSDVSFDPAARVAGDRHRLHLARALCGGPGRLCQAFGVDRTLDAADLTGTERLWIARPGVRTAAKRPVVACRRVGISAAADLPLRFYLQGERYISRK